MEFRVKYIDRQESTSQKGQGFHYDGSDIIIETEYQSLFLPAAIIQ